MGWFDREPEAPVQREAKYSIEKVEKLLEIFGRIRLEICDTKLKVMITKIAWEAIPWLRNQSGGEPSGGDISRMMTSIEMLTKVLGEYVQIQDSANPSIYDSQGGAAKLMQQGFDAVAAYCRSITGSSGGNTAMLEYTALTDYLSGSTSH